MVTWDSCKWDFSRVGSHNFEAAGAGAVSDLARTLTSASSSLGAGAGSGTNSEDEKWSRTKEGFIKFYVMTTKIRIMV